MLTTRNERGHHYLIIDLGGENIQCLTMKYDAHCRFFVQVLCQAEDVPFFATLLKVFVMNRCAGK